MATPKGKKMTRTGLYYIKTIDGQERAFTGRLVKTLHFGKMRLAIFSVPKK